MTLVTRDIVVEGVTLEVKAEHKSAANGKPAMLDLISAKVGGVDIIELLDAHMLEIAKKMYSLIK